MFGPTNIVPGNQSETAEKVTNLKNDAIAKIIVALNKHAEGRSKLTLDPKNVDEFNKSNELKVEIDNAKKNFWQEVALYAAQADTSPFIYQFPHIYTSKWDVMPNGKPILYRVNDKLFYEPAHLIARHALDCVITDFYDHLDSVFKIVHSFYNPVLAIDKKSDRIKKIEKIQEKITLNVDEIKQDLVQIIQGIESRFRHAINLMQIVSVIDEELGNLPWLTLQYCLYELIQVSSLHTFNAKIVEYVIINNLFN